MSCDKIKLGDYIIIQRQKYTKVHKFNSSESTALLGKDQLELKNIEGQPYFTTFKMIPKNNSRKKISILEPCADSEDLKVTLKSKESGNDNRNIVDSGENQNLTAGEIAQLRDSCKSSSEIVGQIIENSKTFHTKTEYAQEKYLKKKEKKYFEYVQIKRPTVRLLSEIFYRQSPEKILGLRFDTLSQILSYSGVCSNGNYLVYESGTNGLIPAALLNSIGANTTGQLIHVHPGNQAQKLSMLMLNLEREQLDRCNSVNIYSVLRQYYQKTEDVAITDEGKKRKLSEDSDEQRPTKVLKENDEKEEGENLDAMEEENGETLTTNVSVTPSIASTEEQPKIAKWRLENERAIVLLKEKMDGLVIVAKEHPSNIIKSLLPFIRPSRPIVVFSLSKEILTELYVELKSLTEVTGLRLISNFTRIYQILPNRTHPDMMMSGNSGYLLYGYTVR